MPYTTESYWTMEELKKMNKAALFGLRKAYLIFLGCIEILLAIEVILCLATDSGAWAAVFLVTLICFPIVIIKITNYKLSKDFKTNKILQNDVTTMSFSEDRLELSNGRGNSFVKYDELYKILETDTNFYLFIAKNQTMNVIKENCQKELITFLQNLKQELDSKARS